MSLSVDMTPEEKERDEALFNLREALWCSIRVTAKYPEKHTGRMLIERHEFDEAFAAVAVRAFPTP